MGEIADAMVMGDMCQACGETLEGWGYPQLCSACESEKEEKE